MPTISCDLAVPAPRIGNVQIVADEREAARMCNGWALGDGSSSSGCLASRRAVILEDSDVVHAGRAFTPVTDQPHVLSPWLRCPRMSLLSAPGGHRISRSRSFPMRRLYFSSLCGSLHSVKSVCICLSLRMP